MSFHWYSVILHLQYHHLTILLFLSVLNCFLLSSLNIKDHYKIILIPLIIFFTIIIFIHIILKMIVGWTVPLKLIIIQILMIFSLLSFLVFLLECEYRIMLHSFISLILIWIYYMRHMTFYMMVVLCSFMVLINMLSKSHHIFARFWTFYSSYQHRAPYVEINHYPHNHHINSSLWLFFNFKTKRLIKI